MAQVSSFYNQDLENVFAEQEDDGVDKIVKTWNERTWRKFFKELDSTTGTKTFPKFNASRGRTLEKLFKSNIIVMG